VRGTPTANRRREAIHRQTGRDSDVEAGEGSNSLQFIFRNADVVAVCWEDSTASHAVGLGEAPGIRSEWLAGLGRRSYGK